MSWTDERVATLTKLWADGLSASQIAAELGGVTRNAVIGKVHRLGLSGRAKTSNSGPKRPKRPRSTYNSRPRTGGRTSSAGRKSSANNLNVILDDLEVPVSKKLDLVDLTEKTCRWPHGDPTNDHFHFCGNTIFEDSPYCEYHCRVAFHPNADRKRDKKKVA